MRARTSGCRRAPLRVWLARLRRHWLTSWCWYCGDDVPVWQAGCCRRCQQLRTWARARGLWAAYACAVRRSWDACERGAALRAQVHQALADAEHTARVRAGW